MRVAETIGRTMLRPRPAATAAPLPTTPFELDHEELVVRRGRRSGAEVIVAVHSTKLGPALGGVRMWPYGSKLDALCDALRLARGMTFKAAAAGLALGGGKGVIRAPSANGGARLRRQMLLDFAELVESLEGRYVTAEDVGTGPDDMTAIAELTDHVTGLPAAQGGAGDPSPFTAIGVEAAIRSCVRHRRGEPDLRGLGVVVIGLGHVGSRLATRLAAAGARLTISDLDPRKRELAARLDARWVDPSDAIAVDCDVLAPCALGGAIDSTTVGRLQTEILCGAANNQLAEERLAAELAARGVLYAPDFIANAGGLINVYRELRDRDEDWARAGAIGIEQTMDRILEIAVERRITPLESAYELARGRLAAALRD